MNKYNTLTFIKYNVPIRIFLGGGGVGGGLECSICK